MRKRDVALGGVVVALLAFTSACSGDDDDDAGPEDTTTADAEWVTTTDAASGIGFELPEQVEPQTEQIPAPNGDTLTATIYFVEVGDTGGVSAAVYTVPSGTQSFDLNGSVEGTAQSIGGSVTSTTDATIDERPALEADITFTQNGVEGRDVVAVVVVDDTYVLQLQSLGEADADTIDTLFQRLVAGVALP